MGLSTSLATDIMQYALRGVPFIPPAGLHVGLFLGDPESGGMEITHPTYQRQTVSFSPTLRSEQDLEYYNLPRTSQPVSHYAVFDDPIPTRGRLIFSEAFTDPSHPLHGGETIRIQAGSIVVV